ncbi:hypothetical protein PMAN_a2229 [Pseudoalteromonas marina]|uniref:hypothetical protein n=1 Tax=Pseudoalteromonas marina TaxID=267375 RepID=UPI00026D0F23|nr:hypothetical protein [Pseudoalteromonas marina]KAF7777023.1 hypothetical protein PMAN_a2229 [Pseudoalteromonas marina]
MSVINFNELPGRIYAGRPNGRQARNLFKLETLDKDGESVEVRFPTNAKSISSSFFLGMFGDSIRYAGTREKFYSLYRFNANEQIKKQIDKAIERALVAAKFTGMN